MGLKKKIVENNYINDKIINDLCNEFIKKYLFLCKKKSKKFIFVIGITGCIAVGKSITANIILKFLKKLLPNIKIDIISTDSFLLPYNILKEKNLLRLKGFPISYNNDLFINILKNIKLGKINIKIPIYSHLNYDIIQNNFCNINNPNILIIEGINIINQKNIFDFFDYILYIDTNIDYIYKWYIKRYMHLLDISKNNCNSFFYKYANMKKKNNKLIAQKAWEDINLKNFKENIYPNRLLANFILTKEENHFFKSISYNNI